MDKVKMGQFLTQLRSEKNLRQQDEAEIFEVSPQAISKWESGDSIPDIATLEKLSHFYNVGIDEIINGERKLGKETAPTPSTVVVARNPTMAERGIGKPYYGAFIYGMSALFLAFVLGFVSFMGARDNNYTVVFSFYDVLFKINDWPTIFGVFIALDLLASACLSIGLWLDKNHRRLYWLLSFSFALAYLVLNIAFFFIITFANPSAFGPFAGSVIFVVYSIAYFVLFLTLPITRKKTYCSQTMVNSDPAEK